MFFENGSSRQLSISKGETMVADADMANFRADNFVGIVMRRSNRNFSIPPSPAKPQTFDYFLCPGSGVFYWYGLPGGGKFDICLDRVGKIEP